MSQQSNHDKEFEIKITEENVESPGSDQPLAADQKTESTDSPAQPSAGAETMEKNNYLEQLQRLQAEFMNYKRRIEKERLELSTLFKSELVGSLLPVIDDFERMLNHLNSDDVQNEFLSGVKLIYQKMMDILGAQGLKRIHATGQRFDPELHEAVMSENNHHDGEAIVAEEWRSGYQFNDRLLRPAQVKVIKLEKATEN